MIRKEGHIIFNGEEKVIKNLKDCFHFNGNTLSLSEIEKRVKLKIEPVGEISVFFTEKGILKLEDLYLRVKISIKYSNNNNELDYDTQIITRIYSPLIDDLLSGNKKKYPYSHVITPIKFVIEN